jgi:hypothetical protein
MRFSAVVALCAAPLALAGTLQADLVARGAVGIKAEGVSVESSSTESRGNENSKNYNSGDNKNSGGNDGSKSITEIIIIWVNNGGGAPTSTMQSQSTFSLQQGAPAAAQTHNVSWVRIIP